jgi:molybdopterin-guanine dinucleotide biosynthesis protein
MPNVIQLSGRKRSGKDWTATAIKQQLESQGYSVEVMSFAEPLKDIASIILNMPLSDLELAKNNNDSIYQTSSHYNQYLTTFRSMLQKLGTEAMKKYFGKLVWYDLLINRIKQSSADYILVPDYRFSEETIPGALTVRIHSTSVDLTDNHISETALDDFVFDHVLDNSNKQLTKSDIARFVSNHIIKENNAQ